MAGEEIELPERYGEVLADVVARVHAAQGRARARVNTELIALNWPIGRTILQQQEQAGWGAKVVERLAADLRREFPDSSGLSRRNLLYMRAFAAGWPDFENVPQAVAQIRGATSGSCSTGWRCARTATGTRPPHSSTGGLARCSSTRS